MPEQNSTLSIADTIHRPFFLAAIITVLTLGCVWGAFNLLTIGLRQSFGATDYSWILAHGHAMVVGFVGFFIMGVAYRVFPRFKHTSLWRPRIAFSVLPAMVIGILVQTVAHLTAPDGPYIELAIFAGALQIGAIFIFALVIIRTIQAGKREPFDRFIYAALGWFLLAAIANPVIFTLFEAPGSRENLLFYLATFNIPYRDVQLLGVAVIMILGVSLRLLPGAYGLRKPSPQWEAFMFWGVNSAILVGVVTYIVGMSQGNHWLLTIHWAASLVILFVAVSLPSQYRLFSPFPEAGRDRSLKFIRAAYVWFIVAAVMLVAVPLYNFGIYPALTGSRTPFSHAFFGAYRHALTVGFIMMMIIGVSSRVVPTFSGIDVQRTNSLWLTFILLNLGNALRVTTEVATDFTPKAYSIMGVSGFIEVVALGLWAFQIVKDMQFGRRFQPVAPANTIHQTTRNHITKGHALQA